MKTRIALSILLIVVSLGLSACGSGAPSGPMPTPTSIPPTLAPTPTPLPTETPAPAQAPTSSADEIHTLIVNALLSLYTQPNRMEVTTVLDDGPARTSTIEFVPPDRKYLVDLDQGVEYIVIGETVYAKTAASDPWEETQIPASTFLGEGAITAEAIGDTISDARVVRSDTLEGRAVIVYGYHSTTQAGGIDLQSQAELWVGEQDGLPYKMISDGEIYTALTDPATGENKIAAVQALVTTLITFDPALAIEPPIP